MSWKPTPGMHRAEQVIRELEADATACGAWLDPKMVFRARMIEVVGKALDQALADGASLHAINAVVGNGHEPAPKQHVWDMKVGWHPPAPTVVPPTADPVGLDMPDFPQPITEADYAAVQVSGPEAADEPAPKKRGRPKGSTNKAKKKARAAKKAGTSLTDIPNAAPEAEPPAGEAA